MSFIITKQFEFAAYLNGAQYLSMSDLKDSAEMLVEDLVGNHGNLFTLQQLRDYLEQAASLDATMNLNKEQRKKFFMEWYNTCIVNAHNDDSMDFEASMEENQFIHDWQSIIIQKIVKMNQTKKQLKRRIITDLIKKVFNAFIGSLAAEDVRQSVPISRLQQTWRPHVLVKCCFEWVKLDDEYNDENFVFQEHDAMVARKMHAEELQDLKRSYSPFIPSPLASNYAMGGVASSSTSSSISKKAKVDQDYTDQDIEQLEKNLTQNLVAFIQDKEIKLKPWISGGTGGIDGHHSEPQSEASAQELTQRWAERLDELLDEYENLFEHMQIELVKMGQFAFDDDRQKRQAMKHALDQFKCAQVQIVRRFHERFARAQMTGFDAVDLRIVTIKQNALQQFKFFTDSCDKSMQEWQVTVSYI